MGVRGGIQTCLGLFDLLVRARLCLSQEPAVSPYFLAELVDGGKPPQLPQEAPVSVTGSRDAEATAVPWRGYCSQPWQTGPEMPLWVSFFPPGDSCLSLTSCFSLRFPAVRTVYCMNEAEIVDVALGILIEVKSTVSSVLLILFTYIFWPCWVPAAAWSSSLVMGIGGASLVAVREFLTAVVSLVVEHGL